MANITKEQIRRIYSLGAASGLLESGNKDDNLHALVSRIAGKDSVSALTSKEFEAVERELLPLVQYKNHKAPLKNTKKKTKIETAPGMMNEAQQSLAWRMIYRLRELDEKKSSATAGERMVGAIKKILGTDARVENPFEWITQENGAALIEKLKRYVRSAEARVRKRGAG